MTSRRGASWMPDVADLRDLVRELLEKRLNVRGHSGYEQRLRAAAGKLDDMVDGYGEVGLGAALDGR